MNTLYAVANEYQTAARQLANLDLDAQTIADTLDGMAGELEHKAQSVAMVIRAMEADAATISQWAKDANQRAKTIESRAEHLRDYLSSTLQACGIQKIGGPGVAVSFRKSSAVVIESAELVPAEFCITPPTPQAVPSKTLIGDAIKSGREVPGARIEHRVSLQIK